MGTKRHTPEEIVAKLRQADVLVSQGRSVAGAIRSIGVTEVSRGGRPKADTRKVQLTLRLDQAVVDAYRATGPNWQTRMNETLPHGARELEGSTRRSSD